MNPIGRRIGLNLVLVSNQLAVRTISIITALIVEIALTSEVATSITAQ